MFKHKNSFTRLLNIFISLLFIGNTVLTPMAPLIPHPISPLTDNASFPSSAEAASATTTVSITDAGFIPQVITITMGNTITWFNNGSVPHSVQSGAAPQATATPTPTDTPTITPTFTPSPTPTSTATNTPTSTSTATSTNTPTATATDTLTPSPTVTGTPPTASASPTATASLTPTSTMPPPNSDGSVYLPVILYGQNESGESFEENIPQYPLLARSESGMTSEKTILNIDAAPESLSWNSGPLNPGESFSFNFTTGGVYDYYDPLQVEFLGQIVVLPNNPPTISIVTPAENAVVGASVLVTGTVSDDGAIVSVLVNGQPANVNGETYAATINLLAGNQVIDVVAEDDFGLTAIASRLVGVDAEGPMITVHAPEDRQSIYTLTPTIAISYTDFYTGVNPTTLSVLLTDEAGTALNVTGALAISATGATGTVSTPLLEDTSYTMTVSLADTLGNPSLETLRFYVPLAPASILPPPEPEQAGWVSGVVYDSTACNEALTTCQGLAGVRVTLASVDTTALAAIRTARQQQLQASDYQQPLAPITVMTATTPLTGTIITGPDGFFVFPAGQTGHYWLRAEKDGFTYAQREMDIVREHSTATNDLFLTPLDSAITPCDENGCTHTNSDGSIHLDIPQGAIPLGETYEINATNFEQVEFLPSGELPPGTWETYAFNLGGASEITFTQPITVSIANTLGFAPGTPIPLGFWNQATQAWEHAGVSVVDPSGQWVVLQVTHFSNWDANHPPSLSNISVTSTDRSNDNDDDCGANENGCYINLKTGEFEEEIQLPSVNVLGESIAPNLIYNTSRATPSEVIDIQLTLDGFDPSSQLGDYIGFELYIEGEKTDSFSFVSDLIVGELGHFRYLWDGQDIGGNPLSPGLYNYQVRLKIPYVAQYCWPVGMIFGGPPDCENGPTGVFTEVTKDIWSHGTIDLNIQSLNPMGKGFIMNDVQHILEDENGHILITNDHHNDEFYFPYTNLLLEQAGVVSTTNILAWTLNNGIQAVSTDVILESNENEDIQVGANPQAVILSPDESVAYVANSGSGTISIVDLAQKQLVNTIAVDPGPRDIALSANGEFAYVVCGSGTISIVNLVQGQQIATITVGNDPQNIALSPDGTYAYVTNYASNSISIINLMQQQVSTIAVDSAPYGIAVSPSGVFAYVTKNWSNTISVINLNQQQQINTITLSNYYPRNIMLSPDGNFAYITHYKVNSGGGTISIVDLITGQQLASIVVGSQPKDIVLSQNGETAYVTYGSDSSPGALAIIDLINHQLIGSVSLGIKPWAITLSENGGIAYVTNSGTSTLSVIDLAFSKNISTITTGLNPWDIELSRDGTFAYLTDWATDKLSIFDIPQKQLVSSIYIGGDPWSIALSIDGNYAYVGNSPTSGIPSAFMVNLSSQQVDGQVYISGSGNWLIDIVPSLDGEHIYVLGTQGMSVVDLPIIEWIPVTSIPIASILRRIAVTPDGTFAYITKDGNNTIYVVDLSILQVVDTINIGPSPTGIAVSPDGVFAYVTESGSNILSVVDLNQRLEVDTILVGNNPRSIVLSPDGLFAYVTNTGSSTVSIVDLTLRQQVALLRTSSALSYRDNIAISGSIYIVISRTATDYSTLTYNLETQSYLRTYPDGTLVQFNPDGTHAYTLEPDGRKTAYTYNPDGSVATMEIYAPSEATPRWVWTFNYVNGKLASLLDPANRLTTFVIDEHGDLVTATTLDGATQHFAYDANHLMTHYTDQNGAITTHEYDQYGRITRITEPPRAVYNPQTGQTTIEQEVKNFTPSDTGYPLINDSPVGEPGNPAPPVPKSEELIDRVAYGQGERSGHTNKWGSWLDETDGEGRTTTHQYDERNNVVRTDYPDGECVVYTYAENHEEILSETHMDATACAAPGTGEVQTWAYTYEPTFNHLKTSTDPKGNVTTYFYDYEEGVGEAGNLIRVEYPQVQDENGQWITPTEHYTYNSLGLLETMTDPRGTVTHYTYTPEGWLSQVIENFGGLNLTTTYQDFDLAGNPQTILYPSCCGLQRVVSYTYDAMNRVQTETDALGNTTTYQYDGKGNVIQRTTTYTDADGQVRSVSTFSTYNVHDQVTSEYTADGGLFVGTWYGYDINRNLATITDGNNHTTVYKYDDANQLYSETDPAGHTKFYAYYPDGLLDTVTDGREIVEKYLYDSFGRLTAQIRDFGGLNLTMSYTYDPNGNLHTFTDPEGTVTRYEYDALNRRILEVRDDGGLNLTTTYTYDLNGNLVKTTDPRGVVTLLQYDPLNRMTQITLDANGLALLTTYQYDEAGNLARLTDERGTVTYYAYDILNRLSLLRQDENGFALDTTYTYDGLGHPVTVTDPNGLTTRTVSNFFGLPIQVTEDFGGLNVSTTYGYDNGLNLTRITDANGNLTAYTYEARNLLTTTTYADLTTVENTYDENGNLATRQDQNGHLMTHVYDGANRLLSRTFPGSTQTFTYDDAGRMTSAGETANGHTTLLTWEYNPLGDVLATTQTLDGVTYPIAYVYDYLAGTTATTYPSGSQVTHTLDPLSRLQQVTQDGSPVAAYTFDDLNGLFALAYPNGAATQTETDALHRITRVWSHAGANTFADYLYGYDDAGNRTYMQRAHQPGQPADVYQYDGLYQLTQVWYGADATDPSQITTYDHLQWYDLDALGNRLEVQNDGVPEIYLPNNGDQLTNPMNRYEQVATDPFAYDLRGNTLVDGTTTYTYDLLNRQITMSGPGGNAEYIYDALGRRIAKVVDGEMTHYVYDKGYRVLEERDGSGILTAHYVYGAGIDEVLTMERGGNTYYYHRDAQTSITEITDSAGSVVERYEYDVYGAPTMFDGAGNPLVASAIGNSYLYTARDFDRESGNYYFRARIYSPQPGRFLQMDPTGYIDGLSLYANYFVLNQTDPLGLISIPPLPSLDIKNWSDENISIQIKMLIGPVPVYFRFAGEKRYGTCFDKDCNQKNYEITESEVSVGVAVGIPGLSISKGTPIRQNLSKCPDETYYTCKGAIFLSIDFPFFNANFKNAGSGWEFNHSIGISATSKPTIIGATLGGGLLCSQKRVW